MNLVQIILATAAIISGLGASTAWFARNRGSSTISLLKTNIEAYKDAEKLKDQRISYLQAELYAKDEIIKKLTEKI